MNDEKLVEQVTQVANAYKAWLQDVAFPIFGLDVLSAPNDEAYIDALSVILLTAVAQHTELATFTGVTHEQLSDLLSRALTIGVKDGEAFINRIKHD